jgi:hypothetical protein
MAPRSVTIQLASGITHATLPDHRKMTPGVQYDVDWETFSKISPAARQSYISVVSVNGYAVPTTGTINLPDTTSNATPQLGIWSILTTSSSTPIYNTGGLNLSGSAFQGWTAIQEPASAVNSGTVLNLSITGPQDERWTYVYNSSGSTAIAAGDVVVWDANGFIGRSVLKAHQSVANTNLFSGVGVFAGVAVAAIPANYYGWIQIEGECAAVNVGSNTVPVGSPLYPDPSNAGQAANSAGVFLATTDTTTGAPVTRAYAPFGTSLTAVANSQVAAQLRSFKPKTPYRRVKNKN